MKKLKTIVAHRKMQDFTQLCKLENTRECMAAQSRIPSCRDYIKAFLSTSFCWLVGRLGSWSVGWLVGWSVGQSVGQTFEMQKMADSDVKISFHPKCSPFWKKPFRVRAWARVEKYFLAYLQNDGNSCLRQNSSGSSQIKSKNLKYLMLWYRVASRTCCCDCKQHL